MLNGLILKGLAVTTGAGIVVSGSGDLAKVIMSDGSKLNFFFFIVCTPYFFWSSACGPRRVEASDGRLL